MSDENRFSLRATAALAALVLVVFGLPGPVASAQPSSEDTGGNANWRSVTLLTGDRVVTDAKGRQVLRIVPGVDRAAVAFSTYQRDGHQYVVPSDAGARVSSGVLDEQLFDVTTLVESGFDDAQRSTLPLLVTFPDGEDGSASVEGAQGVSVDRRLSSVNGVAVSTEKSTTGELWSGITGGAPVTALAAGLDTVWLDGLYRAALDESVPQIGAPEVWDSGYTGEGLTIAVLDSGVDENHPDLAGRQRAEENFSGSPTTDDRDGHGTHVASIAVGSGAASDGAYTGVAHEAEYVDGKVLDDDADGQMSWIIAGMEWAVAEQDADIVNMSIVGGNSPEVQPLEEALNSLSTEHGTLFVVSAGNAGPGSSTIRSPGSARNALTVGAVNGQDELADFSSRGPLPSGRTLKPDLTAPGVGIMAAVNSPAPDGLKYVEKFGTSMAAPHVAGAAALVLQRRPGLSHDQLLSLLASSTVPSEGLTVFQQGSGRIDAARAVDQSLIADRSEIDFGVQRWPHAGEEPARETLTYTNITDSDTTVEFRVDISTGPDGEPEPTGAFTTSESRITVPAGGSASVAVLGDATAVGEPGQYTAALVADDGESTVRTPVALYREEESYELTLHHTGADGEPTSSYLTEIVAVDDGETYSTESEGGTVRVRLPVGDYLLQSTITGEQGPPSDQHLLAYPNLSLDGDRTIELDARLTEPLQISPPDPDATLALGEVRFTRTVADAPKSFSLRTYGGPLDRIGTAHLGPRLPDDQLRTLVNTQWSGSSSAEDFYGLAWYRYGEVPTGFAREVERRDVAKVRVRYGAPEEDTAHVAGAAPSPHGETGEGASVLLDVSAPTTRTEYYNTGDGTVDWNRHLTVEETGTPLPLPLHRLYAPPEQYQPARHYRESFNRPVFGPVLPHTHDAGRWVVRDGNTIEVDTPLFGDGSGNWGRAEVVPGAYTRLFRGDLFIGQTQEPGRGTFDVPAEEAEYRLTTEAERPPVFGLSTRVAVTWTFRSGPTDEPIRVSLPTVRYRLPALDDDGAAPSGVPFVVPVTLQQQGGARPTPPRELSAEVSYDSGQSWSQVRTIAGSLLLLRHPGDADTVSLRVSAADANGSTVEQTVIDAYRLR